MPKKKKHMLSAWVWVLIFLILYAITIVIYLLLTKNNTNQTSRWQIFGIISAGFFGLALLLMGFAYGGKRATKQQLENELVRRNIEDEQRRLTHAQIDRKTREAMHKVAEKYEKSAAQIRCQEEIAAAQSSIKQLEGEQMQFRDQNFYDNFIAANLRLHELQTECARVS